MQPPAKHASAQTGTFQTSDRRRQSAEREKPQTAIILSGGGANGAYEVGVLKALVSGQCAMTGYQPIDPDIFIGTSVGGFNSAFLASQWDSFGAAAVANLERFWLDDIAGNWESNGVFRFRANPFFLLRPEGFLNPVQAAWRFFDDSRTLAIEGALRGLDFFSASSESLEQRLLELFNLTSFISAEPLQKTLSKINFQAIRRSRRWLKVAATNWTTGELRMFWNHDMTDTFGPVALRASAAIPGFFPPVEYGTQLYSDGSVLLNTPLSPAIHAGADVLHVVYLDPVIDRIPLPRLPNIIDTLFRMQQIQWSRSYEDDIYDAARINRALGAIQQCQDSGGSMDTFQALDLAAEGFNKVVQRYRPLTIYRYRPEEAFEGGLGLLNFERERIERLIERGFQDTLFHDSGEAGDIFPDGVQRPGNPKVESRGRRPVESKT